MVTSYLGRNHAAVTELVRLCGESAWRRRVGAEYCNFPSDDPLYQGNQWNEQRQHPALAEADTMLVVDSDVPWIPLINRPSADARIIHIDIDPLKQQMPLWYIGARHIFRADAATALRQINERLDGIGDWMRAHSRATRRTTRSSMRSARRRLDRLEAGAGGPDHAGVSDRLRPPSDR